MGETKFIAVPKKLLNNLDSLLTLFWHRGGMSTAFKLKEAGEFSKCAGELRNIIKGKEHEICPFCGDFLTRDHVHE